MKTIGLVISTAFGQITHFRNSMIRNFYGIVNCVILNIFLK